MTVLVLLGSKGFVGSEVSRLLLECGIEHYCLESFRHKTADEINRITPSGMLDIINCSGSTRSIVNDAKTFQEDNVETVKKIVDAYRFRTKEIIHVSSSDIDNKLLQDDYSLSKLAAEQYLKKASEELGFGLTLIRMPTLWSRHQIKPDSLLESLVQNSSQLRYFKARSPNSSIRVTTEKSLKEALLSVVVLGQRNFAFDESNSWVGSVQDLILTTLEFWEKKELSDGYEKELLQVFLSWTDRFSL